MNAVKVGVPDACLGENAVPPDDDLAHATEPGCSNQHVVAHDYPRPRVVRVGSGLPANLDVVTKDYLTWTAHVEGGQHAEV